MLNPTGTPTATAHRPGAEDDLEGIVEVSDAGVGRDQETPPDQRAHPSQHDPELVDDRSRCEFTHERVSGR